MKQLFFLAILALSIGAAQAQTFKPFKVDVSLGYAVPQGTGSKGGLLFAVEPKYALMDALALGLRFEGAATAAGRVDNSGQEFSGEVKVHGSYLLTGDYYFTNTKARPFAGAGLGLYRNAGVSVEDGQDEFDESDVKTENKFGFMLRGGVEIGHFRTGLEYNFVGNKNGYLGVKFGVVIGGGRLD